MLDVCCDQDSIPEPAPVSVTASAFDFLLLIPLLWSDQNGDGSRRKPLLTIRLSGLLRLEAIRAACRTRNHHV